MPLIQSLGLAHHLVDCEKPEETFGEKDGNTITNLEYEVWINNNGLLTSWILGVMSEEVLGFVVGMETTSQLWKSLEEQLLPKTKEKEVQLKDCQFALKKGSSSLDENIQKFRFLCENLAANNKPVVNIDKVFQFARGLSLKISRFSYSHAFQILLSHI